MFAVVMKLHLWSVEISFAFDEITDGGVFYDHARPERVPREAKKIIAGIGGNFDNNISPTS